MTDSKKLARVYGENEIGKILQRATELQRDAPSAPNPAGMTLAELEDIAVEAGIDPRYLRRAAFEVDTGGHGEGGFWARVVGDDLMIVRETTLTGEIADEGFERIVEIIQRSSREHGAPSLLGRTMTWRAETPSKTRTVQITVTSRDGETLIRAEENLHQFAGGLFGGTVSGVGLGAGLGIGVPVGALMGSLAFSVAFPAGLTALSFLGCREIYRQVAKQARVKMGRLFEQILEEANASIASKALSDASPTGQLPPG